MTEKTIRPGSIQAWFAAIRPKTWGVALAPIFIGISMALSETGHGRLLLSLLTIAVAVAIQALTNMENDVGYTKRKAEKAKRAAARPEPAQGTAALIVRCCPNPIAVGAGAKRRRCV